MHKFFSMIRRRHTQSVNIGSLIMGGENPIRIQSMTDCFTMDTEASVAQCKRLSDAGAELVRLTTPGIREAKNLAIIKEQLLADHYPVPLCADVHYTPNAAEMAALYVEKVRINPGNFIDKPHLHEPLYSPHDEIKELQKIKEKLLPLVKLCKSRKVAIRIGTNHGSLSPRILQTYGDTPEGMVESTLEYLRFLRKEDFDQVVISLKASNPLITVEANRLLVKKMQEENMHFPLHLGVTEAGEGTEGRLNSAVGIAALLREGIGDTLRVSLTEPPENEIPVARKILQYIENLPREASYFPPDWRITTHRKKVQFPPEWEQPDVPLLVGKLSAGATGKAEILLAMPGDSLKLATTQPLLIAWNHPEWELYQGMKTPMFTFPEYLQNKPSERIAITIETSEDFRNFMNQPILPDEAILLLQLPSGEGVSQLLEILESELFTSNPFPLILMSKHNESDWEDYLIAASAEAGYLLLLGYGNGIVLENPHFSNKQNEDLSLALLQAAQARRSKTQFVSCPGCGRTLFNLQQTTLDVKSKLSHLEHLKIAVMGCIVNGPGEMADADYGYVGSGKGKVSLYRNRNLVRKHIDEQEALHALIQLIRDDGKWKEPESTFQDEF